MLAASFPPGVEVMWEWDIILEVKTDDTDRPYRLRTPPTESDRVPTEPPVEPSTAV